LLQREKEQHSTDVKHWKLQCEHLSKEKQRYERLCEQLEQEIRQRGDSS
jgi:hypothetical protein